jgi:4-hydroxy-3-methylbut-2-en-1-yl diphosphate synthase IspG/GcpE
MKNGDRFTCEIKGLSAGVLSVKLNYVDGAISVQWSQVAHLESNRLFLVQTESGAVYTGKLSTSGVSDDPPIRIQLTEAPATEVEVAQKKIIKLRQTTRLLSKGSIIFFFVVSPNQTTRARILQQTITYV